MATTCATTHGIEFAGGVNAAFFLSLNFGEAYRGRHPKTASTDVEAEIMRHLLDAKFFVAPGSSFGALENDWFRLLFLVEKSALEEGLNRVLMALKE